MKNYISVNDPAKIPIEFGEWYQITDYRGKKLSVSAMPLELETNGYIKARNSFGGIFHVKRGEFLRKVKSPA